MQLKLLSTAAAVVAGACALAGNANAEIYISGHGGLVTKAESSGFSADGQMTYGGAVGTSFGPLRVEIGADVMEAEALGGAVDITATDLSATAFLDVPLTENFSGFVGLGAGWIDGEADFGFGSYTADGTEWHYALGASYKMSDNMTLEARWTATNASLDAYGSDFDADLETLTVGLRFAI